MTTFREAVEARDFDAVDDFLHDDIVFRSPVTFKPFEGKAMASLILRSVIEVFEDFHYLTDYVESDERGHALMFAARVDGLDIMGCDFLRYGDDGRIIEFIVMVRPLRAAEALGRRMGEKLGRTPK